MKSSLVFLLAAGCLAMPVLAQEDSAQHPAASEQRPAAAQGEANRSALQVTPDQPAIKNKDLWAETGWLHPFGRMPRYVWEDQKAIWTSPFHTIKANVKWWAIFGGVTVAAIATDKWTVKQLPNTSDQVSIATTTSRLGAAYSLIPISAGFYMIGTGIKNERFRETGLLGFEALVDTTLVETVIKAATDRARPLESDGKGHFWDGSGFYNASFPSGHAINSWALASVVAHQYPHPRIIPILAYAGATLIVSSRVAARRHFPGDVIAGSAMGWFIGDYIYGKRHNRLLDQHATFAQKVLSHIRVGPLTVLP